MSELFDLYQEIILDHNKRPRNFHLMEAPTHTAEGHNPLCGDEITVFLQLDGDTIEAISFQGEGCAISKASASLMTTVVKGKALAEAREKISQVKEMLTGLQDKPVSLEEMGDLASLSGVRRFPVRIKCAILAWHALNAAFAGQSRISTE